MKKCDLILSATIHCWARKQLTNYKDDGPLIINTGSVCYPFLLCTAGYVQAHVLENPLSLVVQYINVDNDKRILQKRDHNLIKIVNEKTYKCF